ncbi:MAG: DNA-directed RNA polymerase, partial [Bdellovibrionota bacterium]
FPGETDEAEETAGEDGAVEPAEVEARVAPDMAASIKWMSQQKVYQRIWEDILLECSLRHDPKGRAVARRLRDTSAARSKRFYARKKQVEGALAQSDIEEVDGLTFAGDIVKLVVEQLAGWFELRQLGGRRGYVCLVPAGDLPQRISGLTRTTCIIDRYAPLIVPPKQWGAKHGIRSGAFYWRQMRFYKLWPKNERIRQFLDACDRIDFTNSFRAVNALQNTAWKINGRVCGVVEKLLYHALLPSADPARAKLPSDWDEWLQRCFVVRNAQGRLDGPGARLSAQSTLNMVMNLRNEKEFYFAYQADTRGRIYPVTGWISPHDEDLSRALLEFAKPKPITSEGAVYLAIHGSQRVKSDRILKDLGITSRNIPTLEDRQQWVEQHAEEITNSALDPVANTWWRDVAGDESFQFLAFCFSWADYLEHGPDAPCALPIHQDGVCNGLQHIAALTRDPALLAVTNIFPGEPQDIYLAVAANVRRFVEEQRGRIKHGDFLYRHPELLGRDIAKSVVMIIPYGAGRKACEDAIHLRLAKLIAKPENQHLFGAFCKHFGLASTT